MQRLQCRPDLALDCRVSVDFSHEFRGSLRRGTIQNFLFAGARRSYTERSGLPLPLGAALRGFEETRGGPQFFCEHRHSFSVNITRQARPNRSRVCVHPSLGMAQRKEACHGKEEKG